MESDCETASISPMYGAYVSSIRMHESRLHTTDNRLNARRADLTTRVGAACSIDKTVITVIPTKDYLYCNGFAQ